MKPGLWHYVKAAFNARPLGMIVPPNWVGVATFALLGLLDPGFWAIGAGLELAYLSLVSTSRRFQTRVNARVSNADAQDSEAKVRDMLPRLLPPARQRYDDLERRCRVILAQQDLGAGGARDRRSQGEGLGRLLWIYLQLLASRQAFEGLLRESLRADGGSPGASSGGPSGGESLERRIQRIERQLAEPPEEPEELRRSLASQLEILQQRLQTQREAHEKLAFLDAELTRVEQQVELIREQAVVSTDPAAVSRRIDQVAAELGATSQWLRDQRQVYGRVEDVPEAPPGVLRA